MFILLLVKTTTNLRFNINNKELYLRRPYDNDHPSFICYVEAVNEVYNKVRCGVLQYGNGWTNLASMSYHHINYHVPTRLRFSCISLDRARQRLCSHGGSRFKRKDRKLHRCA
jgi:hypothetical protein